MKILQAVSTKKTNQGWSLIELIFVIGLLAILTTALTPALIKTIISFLMVFRMDFYRILHLMPFGILKQTLHQVDGIGMVHLKIC